MKLCAQCQQQNQEDSKFCYQCGTALVIEPEPPIATPVAPAAPIIHPDEHLWRQFIGPYADQYLKHFKKFGLGKEPKFALTWNWPAFLYISFLWFLYRKMYVYAAVYALGPMISTYLTGDMTVGLIWSIMAGATANYVYYWHCREHIGEIKRSTGSDPAKLDEVLKESGGVQSYVIWIGVALYVLFAITMFKMLQDGLPDGERPLEKPAKPTAASSV
ncbi:MAG: zinc-ribbon domain-containing protein [Nitrospiraceae bacterium]